MTPATLPHLVCDDFLSETESNALLDWTLTNEQRFKPARLGDGAVNPAIRSSLSLRDLGPVQTIFRDRALRQVPDWIAALRVTDFAIADIELELVAHNDGAHFALHSDLSTTPIARGDRMLSAVYYFHREPKAFSGGHLRLHKIGARPGDVGIDIPPAQRSLVVFPSWGPHEVLPVTCPSRAFVDSRFAVNCWIYKAPRRAQASL